MNYFKAAEDILYSVSSLEKSLKNLESRRQFLIESGKPQNVGAIDNSKPFTDSHYVSDTLNELLEFAECSRNIDITKKQIEYIYEIIEQLSDEHKTLVKLWYIEQRPKEQIAEAIFVESSTTVYNLRNKAVMQFAILYYGASAMLSI